MSERCYLLDTLSALLVRSISWQITATNCQSAVEHEMQISFISTIPEVWVSSNLHIDFII